MNKWVFYLKEIIKKMWFRCCLYCLFALFAFFSGSTLGEFVPKSLKQVITMEGVSDILKILASSMLAVTTFSLSTMVQAFSAAATTATPRANRLLMEDSTAQNALGSFIGAFIFSIVGIIGINSKIYDQDVIIILFLFTVIMIVVIVVMLLRWIDQLSRLGRVTVTIDLVEEALLKSISARAEHPVLECRELMNIDEDSHKSHHPIVINNVGYVQHIDIGKLNDLAKSNDVDIYVIVNPGKFLDSVKPVAYCSEKLSADLVFEIHSCFVIGGDRTFEQDPRYGFVILAEIALRALSPGINDPGTAIDVIGTYVRCVRHWVDCFDRYDQAELKNEKPIKYENVYMPRINEQEILDDMFNALITDASENFVVSLRLKKCLLSMADMNQKLFYKEICYWLTYLDDLCESKLSKDNFNQLSKIT